MSKRTLTKQEEHTLHLMAYACSGSLKIPEQALKVISSHSQGRDLDSYLAMATKALALMPGI